MGLVRGNAAGWGSLEVVASLTVGVVLVVAFVGWEIRSLTPMLPMRFFAVRGFSSANAANFAMIAGMYATLFFLAQYFQTAQGDGPLLAGLRIMPWTGTLMVCGPVAGRLADRFGERGPLLAGLLLQAIGSGWLALIISPDLGYGWMLPPMILAGCGISIAMPAAQKAVVGAVRLEEIGPASGGFSMLRQLGGMFGIAIAVAVFAAVGSYASPHDFSGGFAAVLTAVTLFAVIGAACAAALPGRSRTAPAVSAPTVSVAR
ncbi:MFS transporter [Fodinicola feengrottensis]|uniref:MFS transporter n=1 Tax=Fodinicola feengrottensis TaxID=435914 RepID=UPI002442A005|nr:MFS transporter [Fodinicola feengrottensis]